MTVSSTFAPSWTVEPYIDVGYREAGGTRASRLADLFRPHNKLLNAWTMIANLVLSALLFRTLPREAHWHGTLLFLTCAYHAPFSIGYHLFAPISERTCERWKAKDERAILRSSIGMAFAFAEPLAGPPRAFAYAAFVYAISRAPAREDTRAERVGRVGLTALGYLAPLAFHEDPRYFAGASAALLLGAFAYVSHAPQRWLPRGSRLAPYVNSHVLMHCLVGVAHAFEYAYLADVLTASGTPVDRT